MPRLLFWFIAALVFAGSISAAGAAEAAPQPNIVVILADDLGWGDLSCYGQQGYETPHLDRMAAGGVRMTDFHVAVPFCAPTRSSLLTGRHAFRTSVVGNPAPDGGVHDLGMPAAETTLAEALKEAGYATLCVGKWHLGHRPEFFPRKHGFDEYLGILYSNDMRPVTLVENEMVIEYPVVQAYLTRRYTERVLEFIDEHRDGPFFVYLPHAMPHKPLAVSEAFYTPETPDDLFADAVRELDWSVGQILERLAQLGLDEHTLVVFTSDNGPWYGGSTGGLRGMKGSHFEGGLRVPMIARWPGRIPAGVVRNQLASVVDIFPTVCQAVNVPLPADTVIDGRDLMGVWTDDKASPHEAIFSTAGYGVATVRSGPWKMHVKASSHRPWDVEDWVDPRGPDGLTLIAPFEQYPPSAFPGLHTGDEAVAMSLFNLDDDRAEQHNLASAHPDVVARLKGLYDEMAKQVPPAVPQVKHTAEQWLVLPDRITPDQPVPVEETIDYGDAND